MNIYRISQTVNDDYDTWDSAVVVASSEEAARQNHPGGFHDGSWGGWCLPKDVKVELIGVVLFDDIEAGVVCASYNAG